MSLRRARFVGLAYTEERPSLGVSSASSVPERVYSHADLRGTPGELAKEGINTAKDAPRIRALSAFNNSIQLFCQGISVQGQALTRFTVLSMPCSILSGPWQSLCRELSGRRDFNV